MNILRDGIATTQDTESRYDQTYDTLHEVVTTKTKQFTLRSTVRSLFDGCKVAASSGVL